MSELQPSFICFDAAAPFGYLLAEHMKIPAVQLEEGVHNPTVAASGGGYGLGSQCQRCSMSALPMPMADREKESRAGLSQTSKPINP